MYAKSVASVHPAQVTPEALTLPRPRPIPWAAPPAATHRVLSPYIVAHDAHVYHLAQTNDEGQCEAISLCRQVEQWPAGARYRSGHAKPVGAWTAPHAYRCCSVCAAVAQAQDEDRLSPQAVRLARLLRMAAGLSFERLLSSANYVGHDWKRQAGREAARLELRRRAQARARSRRRAA